MLLGACGFSQTVKREGCRVVHARVIGFHGKGTLQETDGFDEVPVADFEHPHAAQRREVVGFPGERRLEMSPGLLQPGATQLKLRQGGSGGHGVRLEFDGSGSVRERFVLLACLRGAVRVETGPAGFLRGEDPGAAVRGGRRLQEAVRVKQHREPAVGVGIVQACSRRLAGRLEFGARRRLDGVELLRGQDRDGSLILLLLTALPAE